MQMHTSVRRILWSVGDGNSQIGTLTPFQAFLLENRAPLIVHDLITVDKMC
ncbi:unnamed protein product [Haemonchus placei]|uniref:3'-5' exonuclease domain-containing protein n=1 Tax=Haemonchus placei TaxID=6290 RepID=A0A0N4W011_HAEPC|nr:unnamed protein product [Haemonchus placei]